jgi:hypothetical protein
MSRTELMLRELLRCSLNGQNVKSEYDVKDFLTDKEWKELSDLGRSHKISGMLYEPAVKMQFVPGEIIKGFQSEALQTAGTCFRLLFLSRDILNALEEAGIPAVLLKGMGTAGYYASPLVRKSGDVDILIPDASLINDAVNILRSCGLDVKEKQLALHHVVMSYEDTIDVELHTMLAEPFDDDRINRILLKQQEDLFVRSDRKSLLILDGEHVKSYEVLGVKLRVLGDAWHAYELLLHMLQHYLRSGFGIRLLCDWVVFWNREIPKDTVRKYLSLVRESGLKGYSDMITLVCYRHLGLNKNMTRMLAAGEKRYTRHETDAYWKDFIGAGEFGKVSKDRMVALRGNGIADYIREFHHQMKLNYPDAGSIIPLWPVLWGMTFIRFMINNRKIRNISLSSVMRSAGKRGKMVKKLSLFRQG